MIKRRLIQLLSHARKYIISNIFWQWAALLAQICAVFSIASLFENALSGTVSPDRWISAALILASAAAVRFLCDRMAAKASFSASADVKRILREKIYGKLLRLGVSYREQAGTAEVVQLSVEGVEQLETYFGKYLPQLFYSLLAPLTLFIVLCRICLKASIVLLVCVPLMPMAIVVVQKIAKRLLARYWGIYAGLGDSFLENLQGLTTLKIYQADEAKAAAMDRESQRFRKITMKVLTMQLNSTSIMDIVAYGGAACGMAAAILEFFGGRLSLSGTIVICLLAADFFLPLRRLGSYFHIAMNGMAASDKIFALLDLPEPAEGIDTLEDAEDPDIRFENVHFSYEEGREVLKGISFEIPAGSFAALVGESGCGKSTAANLLIGKNKNYTGSIRIGGRELSLLRENSLLSHVVLVGSSSHLFKGTVSDNLLLAKPDADAREQKAVLRKVNLWDFLENQDGLETKLTEGAGNLSGGQRQRLAIARALLADAPVYIFDEATSNIDAESEEMILEVIHELAETKTVLMISHRLSNVVRADAVYMMEKGEIRESGTHAELYAAKGPYRRLFDAQKELEEYSGKAAVPLSGNRASDDMPAESGETAPERKGRRSAPAIMGRLILLVRPLIPVMLAAIILGTAGYLCAIFLTVAAARNILNGLSGNKTAWLLGLMVLMAVSRGLLHYAEQYCNHFIAFRLLAIIRHEVFAKLRTLCPAKLEGKDKGNLISIITADIELLEVFYAHTISPIAIAFLCSVILIVYIGSKNTAAGLLAAAAYLTVGVLIPLWNGKRGGETGLAFRNAFGELNSFVLESLRGLDETIQYRQGEKRKSEITERSGSLAKLQKRLSENEGLQTAVTNLVILVCSYAMLFLMLIQAETGRADFADVLLCTVAMMGSFGPTAALSNLSNSLNQTLASGERVLSLLEEEPEVREIPEDEGNTEWKGYLAENFSGAEVQNVSFAYGSEQILRDVSVSMKPGTIIGIHGVSGSGKSTLLKLLMRFWNAGQGTIRISGEEIGRIPAARLRDAEGYVTQETCLFHDSIANNIEIGRIGASREEIIEAAKKASVHDFIMTLPGGYDTEVGELGDTLSGGERQRIGLARAFLHDAPFLLLDEPTSNLDSLNEGIILRSLKESCTARTIVLVSHRASTMHIADEIVEMDGGRAS